MFSGYFPKSEKLKKYIYLKDDRKESYVVKRKEILSMTSRESFLLILVILLICALGIRKLTSFVNCLFCTKNTSTHTQT